MKGSRRGENEKAEQDEVVMVMVWVCSGLSRMRIHRKRKGREDKEDCGCIISHS